MFAQAVAVLEQDQVLALERLGRGALLRRQRVVGGQGGEQLVIEVSCVGVGDQTATTCNPAVLFSGRLLDA